MSLQKHSVTIRGHSTSFSIEDEFWQELKKIAASQNRAIANLVVEIDETREPDRNLSSAIRVYVLNAVLSRIVP